MSKLAVVIQITAALVAVIAADFMFNIWASLFVAALFSFLVGEALERR